MNYCNVILCLTLLTLGRVFLCSSVEPGWDIEKAIQSIIHKHWNNWQSNLNSQETPRTANSNRPHLLSSAKCKHNELEEDFYFSKRKPQLAEYLNITRSRAREEERNSYIERGGGGGGIGPIRIQADENLITNRNDPRACFEVGQVVLLGRSNNGPCSEENTEDCAYTCTAADIQTAQLQDLIKRQLFPLLQEVFAMILSVQRPQGNLILNRRIWESWGKECYYDIPISESLVTTGIPNTDVLVFVTARPAFGAVAYAGGCNFDWDGSSENGVFGRPLAAFMNFVPYWFAPLAVNPNGPGIGPLDFNGLVRTGLHEMTHALGFSNFFYPSYLDSRTGSPYNPSPLTQVTVSGVSPTGQSFSQNLLLMSTPRVIAAGQQHYGCSNIQGVELEESGGGGTAGSHWELRQLGNEYMTGHVNYVMPVSLLSLSLFEDMGWYSVNYSTVEFLGWGKGQGCEWLTQRCEIGWAGKPGFFCTGATGDPGCTPDRRGKGGCNIVQWNDPLPPYYQHFNDPSVGGSDERGDYCPFYQWTLLCSNQSIPANTAVGEVFGDSSFCFEYSSGSINDLACWPIGCSSDGTLSIFIQGNPIQCPAGGGPVSTTIGQQTGTINCPDPSFFCR